MTDHATNNDTAQTVVDFIHRLANAWDCCGTCAGGVLAARDRVRDADVAAQAKAEAWDEVEAALTAELVTCNDPRNQRGVEIWGLRVAQRRLTALRAAVAVPEPEEGK